MASLGAENYFLNSMAGGDDYTGDRGLRRSIKKSEALAKGVITPKNAAGLADDATVDTFDIIRTGSTGVDINHGWKIHGDFGSRLSPADAAKRMGMGFVSPTFDTSKGMRTVDKGARTAFESRLAKVAPETSFGEFLSSFFGTYETKTTPSHKINDLSKGLGFLGTGGNPDDPSGFGFVDPLDILSMQEAFTEEGIDYKTYPYRYGKGRHFTGYPQSLEQRDKIITNLEARVSSGQLNLVRQDDPTYRGSMASGPTGKGDTNAPLSPHIQGRFTTDYAPAPDPVTGVVDYSKSGTASDPITGYMGDEQMAKIEKLKQTNPEFKEILHGSPGYKSPYRTIEQIAQDRKSGAIPPSSATLGSYKGIFSDPLPDDTPTAPVNPSEPPKAGEPVKPVEPEVEKDKPKAVIETTPSGRPMIKVGTPVKKTEDADAKTPIKAGKPINKKAEEISKEKKAEGSFDEDDKVSDSEEDGGSEDAVTTAVKDIKDVAESEGTLEEALTEKAKEKVRDKIDPVKKIEKSIGKKVEDIKDELLDTVMGSSNAERAKRLASADPTPVTTKTSGMLNRLINASGKAPGSADTLLQKGAREAVNVINKPGITRELLESGGDIARAIAGGTKNSKNLRLAGAATLLSAAGYGIGKVKNRKADVNKEQLKFDPDEEAALRQSLLNDG
jgi:hypothetical protein